jgi:isoleucyl-tRNA synthetase
VTYHNSYIESVWSVLKKVHEQKLLYKDYKVLPWCPRCGTALSSHELAQGYQDDKDLSVTAKFKIVGKENTYLLAWTTTPWTLPGNVALAIGKEIEYVKIKINSEFLILAKTRLSVVEGEYEVVEEMKGEKLVGISYEPLYPFLKDGLPESEKLKLPNAFKVYGADFVNTEDGTGIVHTAVMYGQDDFVLGSQVGLPKYHTVNDDGHFKEGMDFLSGRFVKDEEVAVDIIKDLAHRGLLFKKEKYEHSYPHCWRCKTPLIYYARDSWYIGMSKLRDELVKENEGIGWEPEHIREGRFGEWLREIKDWAISRERYWGTPLPIWQNATGETKVIGDLDDFKKYSKKSGNTYISMRHGEGEHNVSGVLSAKAEDPHHLTEKGRGQVKESAEILKGQKIDLIISSPFIRTKETTAIVAETIGLSGEKITFDERLSEWNVGVWNGTPTKEYFDTRKKSEDPYTFTTEGGESYREIVKRAGEFLYELETKYSGKTILLVSHGAVLRALELVAMGISVHNEKYLRATFKNCDYAEVRYIPFAPIPHNEYFELDLHRPYVDEIFLQNEKGEPLTRVKEVMDVWFDSGAMPFAQNAGSRGGQTFPDFFKTVAYPGDYISEAIDQTRGWFYTLHAIGVLMGRGKAFKNVVCLGHILDAQGKKMSKSLGNIVDPNSMIEKYGVDPLRLWMYSVNQPGDSKNFDEKTVDELVKKVFNPLENILAFYELYKDESTVPSNTSSYVLDRWILARLNELISSGTKDLDSYKVFEASRAIRDFVNDFSTWYIRRSRDRFKSENSQEKNQALATTRFVFLEFSKYLAPFTPFFAEYAYQLLNQNPDPESVHLCDWPESKKPDVELLEDMEKARGVVTKALELRQKSGHKVRQPLASLTIPNKFSRELLLIISDEVNVKEIIISEGEMKLDTNLTPQLIEEGKVRDVIRTIQDWRKESNLTPGEKVTYSVPEAEKEFFAAHSEEIKRVTNVEF